MGIESVMAGQLRLGSSKSVNSFHWVTTASFAAVTGETDQQRRRRLFSPVACPLGALLLLMLPSQQETRKTGPASAWSSTRLSTGLAFPVRLRFSHPEAINMLQLGLVGLSASTIHSTQVPNRSCFLSRSMCPVCSIKTLETINIFSN